VHVHVIRIGSDSVKADRYLDAMEQATGLQGEPTPQGRLYVIDASVADGADRIAANLPTGWQDHLVFEL
jgi:hypothetical protein